MSKKFAQINEDNIVIDVIVADSKKWCEINLGGTWIEATDDNFPSKNYVYDPVNKKFINQPLLDNLLTQEMYLKSREFEQGLSYAEYEQITRDLA